ncbi:MAG: metallophosphoesterase [Planctomycetota bacterium]
MRHWILVTLSLVALWLILWGAISLRMGSLPEGRAEAVTCLGYRVGYWSVLPFAILLYPLDPLRITSHAGIATGIAVLMLAPFVFWFLARRKKRLIDRPVSGPEASGRRLFLTKTSGKLLGIATVGVAADSIVLSPQRLQIRRYDIPVNDLPKSLDGVRIVHISDTHYGPFITLEFLREVIREANAEKPDYVMLTGDYVHQTPAAIRGGISIFRELRPRVATVAVLGNHDHWEGAEDCRKEFHSIGVPMFDNRRQFLTMSGLTPEPVAESLCLAGVGDYWTDDVLIAKTLEGVPQAMPRLMLSHNPDVAEVAPRDERIDLMLSGHTHGGQVWLPALGTPKVPSYYGQKYAGGLVEAPTCRVIVSRGVGMAILPVRFCVPPEISVITLSRSLQRG